MEDFEKSLDIIESLLGAINWLGGDAYEMEATAEARNEASDFLAVHRPEKPKPNNNGMYCLKSDITTTVEAMSKRKAAELLGVGKCKVKCLKQPNP